MKLLPLPRGLRLVLHQQTCAIWAPACHPDSPDVGTAGSWPGRAGLGWAVGGEGEGPEQVRHRCSCPSPCGFSRATAGAAQGPAGLPAAGLLRCDGVPVGRKGVVKLRFTPLTPKNV